jgi:hypothetical protein
MKSYAEDLQLGNRNAVVNRYDARGAYFVGQGSKRLLTLKQIKDMYQRTWQPPMSFAWTDVSYEVIAHDAVVVIGGFDWGTTSTAVIHFSYSALLIRSEGALKLRLEDESPLPSKHENGAADPP